MNKELTLKIPQKVISSLNGVLHKYGWLFVTIGLTLASLFASYHYYTSGLSLAYNDARSHLDIARRVVEGLKPGLAQLGSVWLPLPHLLMLPTVWNDFMWHSGLAGAIPSMISFVITGLIVYLFLEKLHVGLLGRIFGVAVFAANLNILYLQSTAMTELLLLATMTLACYELLLWFKSDSVYNLVKCSFWVMLSTLVRYDGWFLFTWLVVLIVLKGFKQKKYSKAEGLFFFFCTLGGLGIVLWFAWNGLIFGDPLYFAFGPFSAHAQQDQLATAGVLDTKGNLFLSFVRYWYALSYNSILFTVGLGIAGIIALWTTKKKELDFDTKLASTALIAPFIFNILALYLGHSVLFIQGISGNTWFNVRYGIMMMPSFAIFSGYLVHRIRPARFLLIALFCFVTFFQFVSNDAVTIDDGRVGSSQKNVSEISNWVYEHAKDKEGYILVSAASHDAIIFSSQLPMKRFIHEGTGAYWESATTTPDHWARWIIMRTHDTNDLTFKLVSKSKGFENYMLVNSFPFADIYELKPEFEDRLNHGTILQKK